ncbi:MAG: hypothetical protein ACLFR1_04100 [Spirochaetia bacterium]
MKKIFLLITVVTIIIAFTGCDQILEAFYPEFSEGGGGNNTIEIFIALPEEDEATWSSPIIANLMVEWSDGEVSDTYRERWADWHWDDEQQAEIPGVRFIFQNLPDGEYRVELFQDRNKNGYWDDNEPFTEALAEYESDDGELTDPVFRFDENTENNWLFSWVDFRKAGGGNLAGFLSSTGVNVADLGNSHWNPLELLLFAEGEGVHITRFDVEVLGPNDQWLGITDDFNPNAPELSWGIDFSTNTEIMAFTVESDRSYVGFWRYSVQVELDDGSEVFRDYPFRVVEFPEDSEMDGWTWGINSMESNDLSGPPLGLDYNTSYNVYLSHAFGDSTGTTSNYQFEGAVENGFLYLDQNSTDTGGNTLGSGDSFFGSYTSHLDPDVNDLPVIFVTIDSDGVAGISSEDFTCETNVFIDRDDEQNNSEDYLADIRLNKWSFFPRNDENRWNLK